MEVNRLLLPFKKEENSASSFKVTFCKPEVSVDLPQPPIMLEKRKVRASSVRITLFCIFFIR